MIEEISEVDAKEYARISPSSALRLAHEALPSLADEANECRATRPFAGL